jgi:hypothetical protein
MSELSYDVMENIHGRDILRPRSLRTWTARATSGGNRREPSPSERKTGTMEGSAAKERPKRSNEATKRFTINDLTPGTNPHEPKTKPVSP